MDYEAKDWELNPHLYLQDSEGNFVKNKDGTPRKKGGRPPKDAKDAARRTITRKQKTFKSLNKSLTTLKVHSKNKKTTLEKLDNTKEGIVTESDLDTLPKAVKEVLDNHHVFFHANEGPQTDFLAAGEKDVLYGGAAGGGKSYAMIVDPLRYAHRKDHRALILRRSMPELREMIDKSRELYPQAFPGAKFQRSRKALELSKRCKG
jgi:hypothetical protein